MPCSARTSVWACRTTCHDALTGGFDQDVGAAGVVSIIGRVVGSPDIVHLEISVGNVVFKQDVGEKEAVL
jgi:hypothetical protein